MIKQLLEAKHFQRYITILETLTQQPHHLAAFEQAQHQAWHAALTDLEVHLTHHRPEQIIMAVQQRVQLLQQMVTELGGDFSWERIIALAKPHLPDAIWQCYALKPQVIEQLLLAQPPQHTLHYLGYRTLTDYLQKESLYELMAALRFSESAAWMQRWLGQYQHLTAADFEYRPVQFLTLSAERWWPLAEPFARRKKHHFSHLKELGVIFWYPSPSLAQRQDHDLIVWLMCLHYLFEVHFYSQWFAQQAGRLPQFGEAFVHTLQGDTELCARDPYHLPIIQQYHLKKAHPHPCAFAPHVMPEALHWRNATDTLFKMIAQHPQANRVAFWKKCYTVGRPIDGQLVTLNLVDNVLSTRVQFNYHFREELWNGLFAHYFSDQILERSTVHYFASKQIDLNSLAQSL